MSEQVKQEHTPAPWEVGSEGANFVVEKDLLNICIMCFETEGDDLSKANAAHIVHCVNTHEALKASLTKIANYQTTIEAPIQTNDNIVDLFNLIIEDARSALNNPKE